MNKPPPPDLADTRESSDLSEPQGMARACAVFAALFIGVLLMLWVVQYSFP